MSENVTSIKDPKVYIKPTPKFLNFIKENIEELKSYPNTPSNIVKLFTDKNGLLQISDIEWFDTYLKNKTIRENDLLKEEELDKEIDKLISDKNLMQSDVPVKIVKNGEVVHLHDLVDGCEIVLPLNEVIERNPELAARIERLKKEQEDREYKAMTRNVDMRKKFVVEDTIAYQMNMMNRHLIAVGQFVLSVAAGFAFGFLGVELIIGELDFGFRILLGITCALVIALAEFYFLAKHLSEEDNVDDSVGPKTKFNLSTVNGTNKQHAD